MVERKDILLTSILSFLISILFLWFLLEVGEHTSLTVSFLAFIDVILIFLLRLIYLDNLDKFERERIMKKELMGDRKNATL